MISISGSAWRAGSSLGRWLAFFGCAFVLGCAGDPEVVTGTGGRGTGGGTALTGGTSGSGGAPAGSGGVGTGGAASGGMPGTGGAVTATGGVVGSGGAVAGSGGVSGGRGGTGGISGSGGGAGNSGTGGASMGGRNGGAGGRGGAGTGGAAGGGSPPRVCNFSSGLNVAWVQFAGDVPNPNLGAFRTLFQNTYAAGGRTVRWWFHTNGTVTPGYDSAGRALPITQPVIDGIKGILGAANAARVSIVLSLWSFDMLQGGQGISPGLRTNNQNLLTMDANRQAYIDNVLTPLVNAIKGTPGLYSWEIFNEPEGMTTQNGWTAREGGSTVDQMFIHKTVNWLTSAIHTADPTALVTNAAWTFKVSSTAPGMTNYYSDAALRAVGGRANGTLDFYQAHYYELNGAQYSPFRNPASHWRLDKKVVIGEFFARTTDGVSTNDTFTNLYNAGYNGAWAWQYNDGEAAIRWPSMQVPMRNVYDAHMAEVGACR